MFNCYVKEGKLIVANDNKKGLIEKENHDKIEEELNLENEIEVLEEELQVREENKTCKLENIPRYRRVLKLIMLSIFALLIGNSLTVPSSAIDCILPWVDTLKDFVLTIDVVLFAAAIPCINKVCDHFYEKKEKETIENDLAIIILTNELSKKEKELKEIVDNKKGVAKVDDGTHKLDTRAYYVNIRKKLLSIKVFLTLKDKQEALKENVQSDSTELMNLLPEEKAMVYKYIKDKRK